MEKQIIVAIGTKFRWHHADGNPLWEVKRARGRGTWDCEVVATEPDWAGLRKVFSSEEIRASISTTAMWQGIGKRHDEFWAKQKVGTVLHYHDSFGRYVRGRVVKLTGRSALGEDQTGQHGIQPIALVGGWGQHDLVYRGPDGAVHYGFHAQRIVDGNGAFQPNEGNIYESPSFSPPRGRKAEDPRRMTGHSLTPPRMTKAQKELAELVQLRDKIIARLQHVGGSSGPNREDFTVDNLLRALAESLGWAINPEHNPRHVATVAALLAGLNEP